LVGKRYIAPTSRKKVKGRGVLSTSIPQGTMDLSSKGDMRNPTSKESGKRGCGLNKTSTFKTAKQKGRGTAFRSLQQPRYWEGEGCAG